MQNYDHDYGRTYIGEQTEQDKRVMDILDEFGGLLKGRQFEVFQLMRQGATTEQIALILQMTPSSVRTHTERFRKNLRKRYNALDLKKHSMADYLMGAC